MIHVYFGDGKGKTTAALGMAIRAAGCGKRVLLCRFLKNSESGELKSILEVKNIAVFDCGETDGFLCEMPAEKRDATEKMQRCHFYKVLDAVKCGKYDLIVLDEILWLVEFGIISEEEVLKIVENCGCTEAILTGATASDKIIAAADYVTNMKKISHPYDKGVLPREGVEF